MLRNLLTQTQVSSTYKAFSVLDCNEEELVLVPETQAMTAENTEEITKQNTEDSVAAHNSGNKGRNEAESGYSVHSFLCEL